jgi:transposase InsO family protein
MAAPANPNTKIGKGPGPFTAEMCWSIWSERFDFYIELRGITDDATKRLLFFTEIGPIYEELRQMAMPDDVRTMALKDIKELMADRFGEAKSLAAKRHELFSARQKAGQTIRDFAINLRTLITKAEWHNESVDMCLTALFINGLESDIIRAELIKEEKIEFKAAIERAVLLEQSKIDAQAIGMNSGKAEIAKVQHFKKGGNKKFETKSKGSCNRCGKADHWANDCPHKNDKCRQCGKIGHWASKCKTKTNSNDSKMGNKPKKVNQILAEKCVPKKQHYIASVVKPKSINKLSFPPVNIKLVLNDNNMNFELDPGADATLLNKNDWIQIGKPKLEKNSGLEAYGGIPINVLGSFYTGIEYNGKKTSTDIFVIDGRGKNLCGRDLIEGLQIDLNKAFGIRSINEIAKKPVTMELKSILEKYPEVFKEGLGRCTRRVSLKFKPDVQPKKCKPRPVPFALRPEVEKVLDQWLKDGVIEPVDTSEWSTPIVIVPKPGNKIRLCCDYKITVNPWLDIHQYPLPRPDDLFGILNGGQKFSKLDLKEAYLQLCLDEDARKCLTISTHKGLFQFKRMPYGVASAPAIFQQIMEEVLQGIEGIAVYLDDILITGTNDAEHLERLEMVLQRLQTFGLRVKKEKCDFLQDRITYLGHIIDRDGVHTSPEKIESIIKMPAPKNLKELQSFLGMVGYYGKFIPSMSTISEPLNELRRNGVKWFWKNEQQEAFEKIKAMLTSNELLVHYDPDKPLYLATDASDYGVGAVLFHKELKSGKVGVIGYASRTLNSAERNYAQIEKEARGIIFGVEKFNQYLYGRKFVLQTDHEPLKKIFGSKSAIPVVAAKRLHRWSLILMNYDFEIEYCPTREFGNADVLSRLPNPEINKIQLVDQEIQEIQDDVQASLPITANSIADEIKNDKILRKIKVFVENGWPKKIEDEFRAFGLAKNDLELKNGCLMLGTRTVIPKKFQEKILELIHATHPGIVRMKALARKKVWWPGIDKDIEGIKKKCKICQKNGPEQRQVPLHPWEIPERPWQRLHIDFCGPFLGSMWLVIVDAKSKWPEVIRMKNTSAESTIAAIRNCFWTHGLPEQIVSDNGPQFKSAEFAKFCQERGISHTLIAPYHPQSNGEAERFVQTFKNGMKLLKEETNWQPDMAMNQFLLKYRVTPHTATGISPAEIMFGRKVRTLLDLVNPSQNSLEEGGEMHQEKYTERMKRNFDRKTRKRSFEIGQNVFARNYREGSKWMPARIIAQQSSALFLVRTERGIWKRHLDQLKADETGKEENSDSEESDDEMDEIEAIEPVDEHQNAVPLQPEEPEVFVPLAVGRNRRQPKPRKIFDPSE